MRPRLQEQRFEATLRQPPRSHQARGPTAYDHRLSGSVHAT